MLKHSWVVLWALFGTAAAAAPIPEVVTHGGRSAPKSLPLLYSLLPRISLWDANGSKQNVKSPA